MRPLRLELNGLTCFRDRVVVDFAALSLVAIEGPTGAGKSSLLDAIMLALFGVVPRMGAKNLAELIAHGRSGLSVTLDFAVRDKTWRVARTLTRTRGSQAMLSELTLEEGEAVEKRRFNGVLEVQREVRALIGIDVAAFQQAVILPQGQFQEFLQSTPGDRRKILSELLGLQVYALMRQRATDQVSRLGAEVDVIARHLDGDLALASAEAIALLELELGLVRGERDQAQAQAEVTRAALSECERVAARCLELKAIDERLVALAAREPAMAAEERRVARAREVLPLTALVTALEAAEQRAAGLAQEAADKRAAAAATARALEALAEAARDAELAALAVSTHRARIAQLDEARGRLEQHEDLLAQIAKLASEAEANARAQAEALAARAAAETAHAAAAGALAALEAEAVAAPAPEEQARWEGARETASRLGHTRALAGHEQAGWRAAEAAVSASEAALDAAERERKLKEHGELGAEEALAAAAAALNEAEQAARVALMRQHLHVGEACPVCTQPVASVPEAAPLPEVERLRELLGAQRNALERARAAAERARSREAEARVKSAEARSREAELGARVAALDAALAADESALTALVGAGQGPVEAPVEVRYRAGLEAMQAALKRRAEHESALAAARLAVERKALERERWGGVATQATARAAELASALGETRARAAQVEAALAGLGAHDAKKERASLERVIATLEGQRDKAQAAREEARQRAAATAATAEHLAAVVESAEAERVVAEAALVATGWSAAAVRAATLGREALAAAEAEVQAHRAQEAATLAQRAATLSELGPARAGPEDVAALREQASAATAKTLAAEGKVAVLGERLLRAQEQLERAGTLRAEHLAKQQQLTIYRRLSDDLNPRHFQEFLLEEVVADLVRGASERLFGLSGGRYRMAADSSAGFQVVDIEHAGERRSTDTLSGGETFLASLAMALELSEQIRAKAGRVDLDCIFIDEGFGTLDPESLEIVAEAVEGLQRKGRLVGIITHVSELAQRMPERLVVEKSANGSSVRALLG